ncbi:hypothetical protein AAEU33_17665 [Chryseobacterium sp. Chry.R1]|uniref:hypothetical protein n=1 Tax=Chryseobacterium sp. Chry.R1 TaxID=3139392 RepID=UPI0031F8DABB
MEYKESLKLDMKKANSYLSEQTLNFGNRTVLTSAFIILISLNFLTINGIEIEGISISINTTVLTLVLIFVNFYYYQQFILSYDADNHSNFVPEEYEVFKNETLSLIAFAENKLGELTERRKIITEEFSNQTIIIEKRKELLEQLEGIAKEMQEYGIILERSTVAFKKDALKANKFIQIVKRYRMLNFNIPQIIYFIGLFTVFVRFSIYIYYVFHTQVEPWNYLWQNELIHYKVIFQNKTTP